MQLTKTSGSRKASSVFFTEKHLNHLAVYTIFQLQRSQGNSQCFWCILGCSYIAWFNEDEYLSGQKILYVICYTKKRQHKNPVQFILRFQCYKFGDYLNYFVFKDGIPLFASANKIYFVC